MNRTLFSIMIMSVVLMSCGSGKRMVTAAELEKVNNILKKDTIAMEMEWASPLNVTDIANTNLLPVGNNAGNISLIGNSNYFRIIGDSLSLELPYYGERQMAGSYNPNNAGIYFHGTPKVFKKSFNEKKSTHKYYFEANNGTESFRINLDIFSNLKTSLTIYSSQRTVITYRGKVLE